MALLSAVSVQATSLSIGHLKIYIRTSDSPHCRLYEPLCKRPYKVCILVLCTCISPVMGPSISPCIALSDRGFFSGTFNNMDLLPSSLAGN